MNTQDPRVLTPYTGYTNITPLIDLKVTDANSQRSPDTNWHIFGLVYDAPYKEVIIPNGRALYDSIRDCRDWSDLHTQPALYNLTNL